MASTNKLYWFNLYDPLVDPLVLAGSSLSLVATFFVLLTFVIYHREQRSFRHALVLNLTIAEFINSLNATLSGSYFLVTRELTPGMLCSANGWIGQVSVQAGDFSMLAIAVITLLTINEKVYMPAVSNVKRTIICISIWIIPLTTGCIAIGLGVMMPAGANWCWISSSRTDLRYALTHAWRFAIIFAIICIYGYVYYYTSQHFNSLGSSSSSSSSSSTGSLTSPTNRHSAATHTRTNSIRKPLYELPDLGIQSPTSPTTDQSGHGMRDSSWLRLSVSSEKDLLQSPRTALAKDTITLTRTVTAPPPYTEGDYHLKPEPLRRPSLTKFGTIMRIETHKSPETKRIEREVKRMLLMNAYPIFYVLLSVPGLVNRLLQASGSTPPGRVLDALQAASAFIGFTNAVTYGFNRHLRRRIASDISSWWTRKSNGLV